MQVSLVWGLSHKEKNDTFLKLSGNRYEFIKKPLSGSLFQIQNIKHA